MNKVFVLAACLLLGLSAAHAAPTFTGASVNGEELLPVALKCDDENHGTMEVVSRNRNGSVERLRVVVASGEPVRIIVAHAFLGWFEDDDVIDLAGQDADNINAQDIVGYALGLRASVCMAPAEARQQAYLAFKANETMLTEGH
jgi:hypothetical protein